MFDPGYKYCVDIYFNDQSRSSEEVLVNEPIVRVFDRISEFFNVDELEKVIVFDPLREVGEKGLLIEALWKEDKWELSMRYPHLGTPVYYTPQEIT